MKFRVKRMPFLRSLFYAIIAYMVLCIVYLHYATQENTQRLRRVRLEAGTFDNHESGGRDVAAYNDRGNNFVTKHLRNAVKFHEESPNYEARLNIRKLDNIAHGGIATVSSPRTREKGYQSNNSNTQTVTDGKASSAILSDEELNNKLVTTKPEEAAVGTTKSEDVDIGKTTSDDATQTVDAVFSKDATLPTNQDLSMVPKGISPVCMDVFRGEISNATFQTEKENRLKTAIRDFEFHNLTTNCTAFKSSRGYYTDPSPADESDFPLAYAILMYKSANQVEQLLRAIYRPQNFYCIHVDQKSPWELHQAMNDIARCFNNVFISSENVRVTYQSIDQVTAELICMRDLLKTGREWKYYLNLAGQEFPLKTNREIVQILKLYNGSNDVTSIPNMQYYRLDLVHLIRNDKLLRTAYRKDPPPRDITFYKGEFHSVLSRQFVEYIFTDGMDLYEWLKDTQSPSEYFYPTLNRLADAPGGFPKSSLYLARAKFWDHMHKGNFFCRGRHVHGVCIMTHRDLPVMLQQPHLFANKFYYDEDPLTVDCLGELVRMRTQYPIKLNMAYYTNFIENRTFPECRRDMATKLWHRMFMCMMRLSLESDQHKWYTNE